MAEIKVWSLVIEGDWGIQTTLHASQESAAQKLADFVAEHWDGELGGNSPDEISSDDVEHYFSNVEERADIEEHILDLASYLVNS